MSSRSDLSQCLSLRLSKITVDPTKDRRGSGTDLRDLLESLAEVGLLHPLLVLPADDDGHHQLLAGYRRLRAARQLGWEEVPARIVTLEGLRPELAGLAENLARKALPPGEELRAIARAKIIYENLHPDARQGGARHGSDAQPKTESFADYTARHTGVSTRTIRRKAMVGCRADETILTALDEGALSLVQAEHLVAMSGKGTDPQAARWPDAPPADPSRGNGAEAAKAVARLDQEALVRTSKKLLVAAEAVPPKVRVLAATMDFVTRQSCRDHLVRAQAAIAEALQGIDRAEAQMESSHLQ